MSLDLPRLLGEVHLEIFFYTVPRKQHCIFHGGSVMFWFILDVLRDLFASGVVAENGSF